MKDYEDTLEVEEHSKKVELLVAYYRLCQKIMSRKRKAFAGN